MDYPPPFKVGSAAYMRWYRSEQAGFEKARVEGKHVHWPTWLADAKKHAYFNPPKITATLRKPKLFGGALTPEYRAWYYRTLRACKALPTHEQNWPEFFRAAREVEERRQGLVAVATHQPKKPTLFGGANTAAYRAWYRSIRKIAANMNATGDCWPTFFFNAKCAEMERQGLLEPLKPKVHIKSDNVIPLNPVPAPASNIEDGPLRFDFTVAPTHHLVTDDPRIGG